MSDSSDLVELHILQVPIPLWSKTQQQTEELLREFALATEGAADGHPLPAKLTSLIETLTTDFGGVATEQDQQLYEAAQAGLPVIDDLVYRLPPAVSQASQVLGDMLDEADDYCRGGQYLLTLAADDDVVRFRRWYLSEFIRQLDGQPATPWPSYDGYWPSGD